MKNPTTSPSSPRKSLALCRAVGIALLVVSAATPWAALASTVPLDFPVELSRPARLEFNAYYGEAIDITATLNYQGSAFEGSLTDPQLYYQTPTMGTSFWSLPATQTNNLLKVVFPASAQPGPGRLNCFLGSAGENYRAAFVLNLRPSPGASPNSLPLPTPTLDFSQVTILNSPYETSADATTAHTNLAAEISAVAGSVATVSNALETAQADLSRQIAAATPADYADVKSQVATNTSTLASHSSQLSQLSQGVAAALTTESDPTVPAWAKADNKPTYAYSEITGTPTIPTVPTTVSSFTNDVGYLTSYTETDPTISSWAKADTKPSYTLNEVAPDTENWLGVPGTTIAGKSIKVLAKTVNGVIEGGVTVTGSSNNDNNTTKYRYGGVSVKRNGTNTDYLWDETSQSGIVRRSELGSKANTADVATISNKVDVIETWAIGNDVAFTVHNAGSTNATFSVAYTNDVMYSSAAEATNTVAIADAHTSAAISNLVTAIDAALDQKANKAWGETTSGGAPSPEDTLCIEKEKVSITGGGNYSYIEAGTGGYWVMAVSLGSTWTLQSLADAQNPDNPMTLTLRDSDGNPIATVTSTASREVYAVVGSDITGIDVVDNGSADVITIPFPVVAAQHPTLEYAPSLTNTFAEATSTNWPSQISSVVWSGSSGLYTATITTVGRPGAGFFKAKYIKEGETYVNYNQPIGFTHAVIGGTNYPVKVVTINGIKCIGLEDPQ